MDNLPFGPERPKSILSTRDRRYLTGESDIEPRTQKERDVRAAIRDRIWNGMLDLIIIADDLDERDFKQIFSVDRDRPEERLTKEQQTRRYANRVAFAAMFRLIYRATTTESQTNTQTFEQIAEQAIEEELEQQWNSEDPHVVQLSAGGVDVEFSITPTPAEEINLDTLRESVETYVGAGADADESISQSQKATVLASRLSLNEVLLLVWTAHEMGYDRTGPAAFIFESLWWSLASEWSLPDYPLEETLGQVMAPADEDENGDTSEDA